MYYTGIFGQVSWDSFQIGGQAEKFPRNFSENFSETKSVITGGNHQMEKTKAAPGKPIVRDSDGRFVEGNKEGRKFPKGYPCRPKGAKNKKTLLAREFATDVLYLDLETGKRMTYHQLCMYIKQKADTSPRILNLLLDHCIGKPVEQVQHREFPTWVVINSTEPQDKAEDAKVVDEEQFSLPEPE
jgi:hypothetical protein